MQNGVMPEFWPDVRPRAFPRGIAGVHIVVIRRDDRQIGAINSRVRTVCFASFSVAWRIAAPSRVLFLVSNTADPPLNSSEYSVEILDHIKLHIRRPSE